MPRCGTLGDLFLILVHRGATAAAESASAEATHGQFAHRLPDAVNKAGTGRALRVMRIARTAQKKFNIPVRAINGKNSKSVRQRLFCACKTKYERGDLFLSHAWYGGRIPGNTGYMGALACVGSTPAAPSFVRERSCPKRKKPGLILGFRYVPLRVHEPGGAMERRWCYGCKAD